MARPTKRVRVIVLDASGCCASAVSAVATARPSLSAGPIQPKLVVTPAVIIDAIAINVMLSMVRPLFGLMPFYFGVAGEAPVLGIDLGTVTGLRVRTAAAI